jgi:hypothetical protein
VKGFVFPDWRTGDLYFATDNYVWALHWDGATITNKFPPGGISLGGGVIPTSAVLFVPGSHYVYVGGDDVGGGNPRLYEIDVLGPAPVIKSVQLGDGGAKVGSPSLDWPNDLVHVGTEAGVFYAVEVPLPQPITPDRTGGGGSRRPCGRPCSRRPGSAGRTDRARD